MYAYDKDLQEVFNCEINSEKGISSVDIGDLENYLFQSKCMKQFIKIRPGNKFIVIGGTAGMRELAEKDSEKVNITRFNTNSETSYPDLFYQFEFFFEEKKIYIQTRILKQS